MPRIKYSSNCQKYNLLIRSEQIHEIYQYCRVANSNETGGMVIGLYDKSYSVAMTKGVLGPTLDSQAGSTWFYRGVVGLKSLFNNLWKKESLHLIGEWHFHPGGPSYFSSTDVEQILELANNDKYKCLNPILLIVGEIEKEKYELGVYVLNQERKLLPLRQIFPTL